MKNTQKTQKKQKVDHRANLVGHGVGRRKRATARVWLKKGGKGDVLVNGKDYVQYFDTDMNRNKVKFPFNVTGQCPKENRFEVQVNVAGGGMKGQAEAVRLGISRALLAFDGSLRPVLRKNSLLTVDARNKERKKYGQRGARRKFQFVKR